MVKVGGVRLGLVLCFLLGHDYRLLPGRVRYRCQRCRRFWP